MRKKTLCHCQSEFLALPLKSSDYKRFKNVLNLGNHPGFVGQNQFARCCVNGGSLIFVFDGHDVAVSSVNPKRNTLLVLNISPSHRGHGLGKAIMKYLAVNFVRSTESAKIFFEGCGFEQIGQSKNGRSLKIIPMVRSDLIPLVGKLKKVFGSQIGFQP